MTKHRAPLSAEQALQRIAGQLPEGVDQMARITNRQPGTVRAWMDPDRSEQVGFECAIALDLEFQAAGGEGAPLYEGYAAKLDLAEGQRFADRHRLLDFTQGVVKEGGEAHAALITAALPGATHKDFGLALREAVEAYEKLRDVIPLLEAGAKVAASTNEEGKTVAQAP